MQNRRADRLQNDPHTDCDTILTRKGWLKTLRWLGLLSMGLGYCLCQAFRVRIIIRLTWRVIYRPKVTDCLDVEIVFGGL